MSAICSDLSHQLELTSVGASGKWGLMAVLVRLCISLLIFENHELLTWGLDPE